MLKLLAILANIAALGVIAFLWITEGLPHGPDALAILTAFIVGPVLNLLYIACGKPANPNTDSLWRLFIEALRAKLKRQIADTKTNG